jgi:hypothetical protein
MDKKRTIVIACIACCFFAGALLLIVYGAGFSWSSVILALAAISLWGVGNNFWKTAFPTRAFIRFQFRIVLNISQALHDAGLYGDELSEASALISEGLAGHGSIVFTWLEPELFYINTTNLYSSRLDIHFDLPAYGARANEPTFTRDRIEMRYTMEGYELVLQTGEHLVSSGPGRSTGVVLFKLPYKAFWAMQRGCQAHEETRKLLEAAGFTYSSFRRNGECRNQYGWFRWKEV